ncbi:MAG: hypothetical protein QOG60_223 [Frankiaceae bacterium]|nr:hypothetical protein [Frankiaceae bacterium]MDQ1672381.1 hypothetical protein [Frankiaceae bacterium]
MLADGLCCLVTMLRNPMQPGHDLGHHGGVTSPRTRDRLDAVCAAAVDVARAAADEEAGNPAEVGDHLGVLAEAERLVVHRFVCLTPAYRGWYWAVSVARASRARNVTVDEVVLLPGDQALIAPEWVPWSERLQPGDLGVGDLLPTAADDERLALRNSDVELLSDDELFMELGLGRPRVLSLLGREETATRWIEGDPGPTAKIAKAAPARCESCGFHVRLVGAMGRLFGACCNEYAPDDGQIVSLDHGCGAHSEALVLPSAHPQPIVLDDDQLESVPAQEAGSVPDTVRGGDEGGEPYGHS